MLKRKKILSLCCALILLISIASPAALADETPTNPEPVSYPDTVFSIDSVEAVEGNAFDLTVSVKNNHGLCGYKIALVFDASAFTFVTEKDGKTISPIVRGSFAGKGSIVTNYDLVASGENNVLNITYFSSSEVEAKDGTLCIIRLRAKSENIAGTYPVALTYDEVSTLKWDDHAASTLGRFPHVTDIQCVGGEIVVSHDWDEGVKVPSVTIPDPAVIDTLYTCKVCGETRREHGYDPHHWQVTENVAPTCTAEGHISYKCTDCDLTRTEVVPATGHTWGSWTSVDGSTHSRTCTVCQAVETGTHDLRISKVDPTCTQPGKIVNTCQICSYSSTENDPDHPALGHDYETTVVAPTCTEAGYTLHQCARCGEYNTEPGAPATGHTWSEWRVIRYVDSNFNLVTHPENHQRVCSVCKASETAAHNMKSTDVAPTCTEAGYTLHECADCPYNYKVETAPATGHKYAATRTVAPTCTERGYTIYTCETCGSTENRDFVPATGHTYGDWVSVNNARHQRTCTVCGNQQSESHTFAVTEVPATCTEPGSKTSTCTVCGESYTTQIPATGHKYARYTTKPTCTEDGYVTYVCQVCRDKYVEAGAPATGHTWGEWEDNGTNHVRKCQNCDATETGAHSYTSSTTPPTCTEAGVITETCELCGHSVTSPGAPATGHTWGKWESKDASTHTHKCVNCDATESANHRLNTVITDPTCTVAGRKSTVCADCGYTVTESIPATGHSFGQWRDNGDNHIRSCANCDAVETASHSFTVTETAPTCTEPGSRVSTCSVCGKTVTESIPAAGHKYTSVVTAPTCTEKGYTTYTCSVCGDTYTGDETAALGHDYKSVVTAPTCTEAGYTTYTCSRCGDTYTRDGAPATGHTWGKWESANNASHIRHCQNCDAIETAEHNFTVVVVEPTDSVNGSRTSTCADCGFSMTEIIPAKGHHYVAVETAPTCTQDGYITYTCSDCGNSYVNPGAPALGHNFGQWEDNGDNHIRTCSRCSATEAGEHRFSVTETAPTCSAAGSRVSTCSDCGKTVTETIPAIAHKYESVVTPPTCTEAGYTTYTCSVCGDSYTSDTTPATGHTFGSWTSVNDETHMRKCANCDVTEVIAHNFSITVVPPTADKDGTRTYNCPDCGFTKTENIPATGHNYVAVVTPPTCTEAGYITYTCSDCGDTYTESGAAALGHDYVVTVIEPTETEGGYTLHQCSRCGDSFKDNFTDPTGTTTPILKGDVNLDGQIDNADLILVARYVVLLITFNEKQFEAGDMDSNGIIDNADVIRVARIIVNL